MRGTENVDNQEDASDGYDAFLSHSSADRRVVQRMQNFLQAYRFGPTKQRVRVFRDYSDLPAGELSQQINEALAATRFLVVVSSPAAVESRWVEKEIEAFDALQKGESSIGVAVIEGQLEKEAIEPLKGRDFLRHDLRKGWRFGIPRLRTRIELLRILAAITGQSMRSLVKWHVWRTMRNWGLTLVITALPFVAFLSMPVSVWEEIDAVSDRGRLYAIFAEVKDERIEAGYRFRGQGPPGFRNYIWVTQDAQSPEGPFSIQRQFRTRRRLLPCSIVEKESLKLMPELGLSTMIEERPLVGELFACSFGEDRFIAVQGLGLTEDEEMQARDEAVAFGWPIPRSVGAVIATVRGDQVSRCVVWDLNPFWNEMDHARNPTPPRALCRWSGMTM